MTGAAPASGTGTRPAAPPRSGLFVWLKFVFALLAILAFFAGPAAAAEPQANGQVISSSSADLDGDGRAETVEVVMSQGRRWLDGEPWCGAGDKWQGEFVLRVKRQGRVVSQRPWHELSPAQAAAGEEAFFWAPEFRLVFVDYNGDGRLDFNLGQYGSCNGNLYILLTLDQKDRLTTLPIQDRQALFVSPASRDNSSAAIKARDGVLTYSYYDNVRGGMVNQRLKWQGGMFRPAPE